MLSKLLFVALAVATITVSAVGLHLPKASSQGSGYDYEITKCEFGILTEKLFCNTSDCSSGCVSNKTTFMGCLDLGRDGPYYTVSCNNTYQTEETGLSCGGHSLGGKGYTPLAVCTKRTK